MPKFDDTHAAITQYVIDRAKTTRAGWVSIEMIRKHFHPLPIDERVSDLLQAEFLSALPGGTQFRVSAKGREQLQWYNDRVATEERNRGKRATGSTPVEDGGYLPEGEIAPVQGEVLEANATVHEPGPAGGGGRFADQVLEPGETAPTSTPDALEQIDGAVPAKDLRTDGDVTKGTKVLDISGPASIRPKGGGGGRPKNDER